MQHLFLRFRVDEEMYAITKCLTALEYYRFFHYIYQQSVFSDISNLLNNMSNQINYSFYFYYNKVSADVRANYSLTAIFL